MRKAQLTSSSILKRRKNQIHRSHEREEIRVAQSFVDCNDVLESGWNEVVFPISGQVEDEVVCVGWEEGSGGRGRWEISPSRRVHCEIKRLVGEQRRNERTRVKQVRTERETDNVRSNSASRSAKMTA